MLSQVINAMRDKWQGHFLSNFVELNIWRFEGAISQFFVAMNAFILKRVQLQVGKLSPSFYQVSTIVFNMRYKLKDLFNFYILYQIRYLSHIRWGRCVALIIIMKIHFPDDLFCFGLGDLDSQCFVSSISLFWSLIKQVFIKLNAKIWLHFLTCFLTFS